MNEFRSDYGYSSLYPSHTDAYILPEVERIISSETVIDKRIFEVGCGNGATAARLSELGYEVTAIDVSRSGIEQAKKRWGQVHFEERSVYEDLHAVFGQFSIVISLEVVEHLYWPRRYAKNIFDLLSPGGVAIVSTPFHGYFKNLAIVLANKSDDHWSPLWDNGHIKFWSEYTLRCLLCEAGFTSIDFVRVGRMRPFAKSMIAIARKAPD